MNNNKKKSSEKVSKATNKVRKKLPLADSKSLPPDLNIYQSAAQVSLANNMVQEIEFLGPVYRFLIKDNDDEQNHVTFIQLDDHQHIQNQLCSCSKKRHCLHVAVAYLAIFKQQHPLHLRFADSLWHNLCALYEDRLGSKTNLLSGLERGKYVFKSSLEKTLFTLQTQGEQAVNAVDKIIADCEMQKEELVAKFAPFQILEHEANLQDQTTASLRYDLSYWGRLARLLFQKQELNQPYKLTFKYSKKKLPNWFQINFDDLQIGFYISEANLPLLIDSLLTVNSPLIIYNNSRESIASINYDAHEQTLHITPNLNIDREVKLPPIQSETPPIHLQGWLFFPNDGFYAQEAHELLKTPVLHGDEIAHVLTDHARLIATLIKGCCVHLDPVKPSYSLNFDHNWDLHIIAYLFEPGDLTKGHSWLIENWAYLESDGFYPIEDSYFDAVQTIISVQQVADFVTQNRSWLNLQEGFGTHVKSIEYQLTYQVSANQRLSFSRQILETMPKSAQKDFGTWVYSKHAGFYSKTASSFSYLLKPGISLTPEQVPLFIRMNREELMLIPNFFSSTTLVARAGLRIELCDHYKIKVSPEYELLSDYEEQTFYLYDDFLYVEGEGFCELPIDLRLPEKFRYPLELEEQELSLFLTHEFEQLRQFATYVDPRLIKPSHCTLVTDMIEPCPDLGRGWYRFHFFYRTDQGIVSLKEILQAIQKKQEFAFFEAGLIDLRLKQHEWLWKLKKDAFDKLEETLSMSVMDFMRLNAFDPITFLMDGNESKTAPSFSYLQGLLELQMPQPPNIDGLLSDLRPYQEIGTQWLWFLYSQQLSGLLCDDMGLGKTHQAMALLIGAINAQRAGSQKKNHHFLIVSPTSVIYHWQEKLNAFLPSLRVYTFYGNKRSLADFDENYDILLTSYGILRNEKEIISKMFFEIAIFDEIQVAKNQFSHVYKALTIIRAAMKLGLTGTPIENHLRELKSLFDIVLPTYMPVEHEYRDFFIKPIEKEHNPKRRALLNRLIAPFILRRKKEQVLKDLPEKIEEIAHCDLTPYQHQLYLDVLRQKRDYLMQELVDESKNIPFLHIFSLLSSLKQICDHPAVYLKTPQEYQKYRSGKWELFVELLREARESEQKVVVFSQYLGMLDIIEYYLAEQHIGFAALRGGTQKRKEQLDLFSKEANCEVFVGSLHAAGLGVDLTAGSVVIHYDRWWNAARENQATDRVHRIGQTRGVQVFKLVTKGTFEEKIDAMITRKGKLMEDVIGIDDQNALKVFSRSELMELLEWVGTEKLHTDILDEE